MPDDTAAVLDALTLLGCPRIGIREWHKRVAGFGSATAALEQITDHSAVTRARDDALAALDAMDRLGGRALLISTDDYPRALHQLTDAGSASLSPAPPVLFVRGELDLLERTTVAIVGTRHASATGLRVADRLARECANAGATVISGLAKGIDGAAHAGALSVSGPTAAVIGTGLDLTYPAEHRTLQRRIGDEGLLVSETPPGQRATRGSFPERNRLIAALASVTVVVEAGHRSGALLTALAAQSLGREVAVVPGPFDAASCQGSNALLRDGAQVIASVDDLLQLLGAARADATKPVDLTSLSAAERAVWDQLSAEPLDLDLVLERVGWSADACLAAVTTLELKGLVRASSAGALQRA